MEQATQNLEEGCCENQLLINPAKTKSLLVDTRQLMETLHTEISLNFLRKTIKPVSSAKDLGVILDSHLTDDSYIAKFVSSCMAKLCQIKRVKDRFDNDTLLTIIGALVISKLLYCSNVWSNTSSTNIKKLQAVQNFACRIITKTKTFDHITHALHQLNWLPVEQLLLYRNTVLTYKCFNDCAPSYLCNKFSKRSETHDYTTRN